MAPAETEWAPRYEGHRAPARRRSGPSAARGSKSRALTAEDRGARASGGRFRRPSTALARGRPGRGARAPERTRGAQRSALRCSRPQCQRFRRRVGGADASSEERPGAALARDDAGPRSTGSEHRRRVRRRDRESRGQALQRPRGARTARPRRCRPNLLGRRARRSERSAKRRRCPGGARGRRSGRPGRSPSPAPHRSGRAGLPHPALQGTASLHVRWWTSRAAGSG